jgi:hypothetical protein
MIPVFLNNRFPIGRLSLVLALVLAAPAAGGQKTPKPEDVVERAIMAYGSRAVLSTIQHNGVLRGRIKFIQPGGVSEGKTTNKFIRKHKLDEDLLMLELELPDTKFVIGFDGKQTWSVNNGEVQEPSADTVAAFRSAHTHGFEAVLRYKENDGKLEYVGSKQFGPNNDLDIIDLTLPDGNRTRYEISRRSGRIIYLDYEDKKAPDGTPVKYRLYFKDFRVIQNTLVPYEVQVFRDGTLIEERKLVEVAYSVHLEESAFKVENANKPTEAVVKP